MKQTPSKPGRPAGEQTEVIRVPSRLVNAIKQFIRDRTNTNTSDSENEYAGWAAREQGDPELEQRRREVERRRQGGR